MLDESKIGDIRELYPGGKFIDQSKRKNFKWTGNSNSGRLEIGNDVALNDCTIDYTGGVSIGDRVHFGREVMVLSCSHPIEITDGLERRITLRCNPVVIHEDVYIGSRATILEGVNIGKGSYIAAGSIVTKDVLPFTLVAGVPARVMKNLNIDNK